ncbi:Sigma factor binding protein 1, chloroplastic [Linum grandiflorum]
MKSSCNKKDHQDVKVVYISTPMKVKTSAADFRALVQELTGKDSDTARLMEVKGNEELMLMKKKKKNTESNYVHDESLSTYDRDNSSSPFIHQQQEALFLPMEGSFMSLFQPNFLTEFNQLDGFNY